MLHPAAGLGGLLLGAVCGPFLAGLTARVPAGEPLFGSGWWFGRGAGGGRRGLLAALGALGAGLAGLGVGWHAALPAYLWFGLAAAVLTVVDVEHHRLPNRVVYPT